MKKDHTHVLVVDPRPDTRTFLSGLIGRAGKIVVKNASSGQEALDLLQQPVDPFHIVIFDWALTDMTGAVFAHKVKSEVRRENLEAVVISHSLTQEESFLLTELDIWHTISKGESGDKILDKIKTIVSEYRTQCTDSIKLRAFGQQISASSGDAAQKMVESDPKLIESLRSNPRFMHFLGEYHILRGQFDESIQEMQNMIRGADAGGKPETLKVLSTLGKALCLAGRYEDAVMIFERLAAKSPKNLKHKISCGDALLGLERHDEAESYYTEALTTDGSFRDALMGMGKVSVAKGDPDSAQGFFDQIGGNFESYSLASFFNNRGVALARSGRTDEALQLYNHALIFLNKFKPYIMFNMGLAYEKKGNKTEASACFKAVMESEDGAGLASRKQMLAKFQETNPCDEFISDFRSLLGGKLEPV